MANFHDVDVRQINTGQLMFNVIAVANNNDLRVPAELAMLAKTLLTRDLASANGARNGRVTYTRAAPRLARSPSVRRWRDSNGVNASRQSAIVSRGNCPFITQ